MAGIVDGQPVNASASNAAWIAKNGDDATTGRLDLNNALSASGSSISNTQRNINSIFSFVGASINGIFNLLPTWATNNRGSSSNTVFARVEAIDTAFDPSTGHKHTGAAGDAPQISASAIASSPLSGFVTQGTDISGVTGTSWDVSSLLTGKTQSTNSATIGVVVNNPQNKILLRNAADDTEFKDATGNVVYGRLTFAASVWTLTFYSEISGTETSYNFISSSNIRWYYQEIFSVLGGLAPVYSEFAVTPSDNATADVVDASATQRGVVNTTTQSFAGNKTFTGTIGASNFSGSSSGTNTGDVTLAAVGSSPNANAASLSSQVLNLQPADGSNPGVVSTGTQTFAGNKTFSGTIGASNFSGSSSGTNTGDQTITLTSDVTGSGTGSITATIAANAVTNSKLATMAANTVKANVTGSSAVPTDVSIVSTATASAAVIRDTNANTRVNNLIENGQSTATNATTTTLTVSSAKTQIFTGSTTHTCKLPDATTLVLFQEFFIRNASSGAVTVVDNGSNTVQVLAGNSQAVLTVTNIGSANGTWDSAYSTQGAGSGSVTSVAFSDASTTPLFTISGSPVTTSGTISETLAVQNAGKLFAGPTDGADAQPNFKAIGPTYLPIATNQTNGLMNVGISTSVGSNILTIALKQNDGSTDGSAASPIVVSFRNATATTGGYIRRAVTAALSQTFSLGTTLGTQSALASKVWFYLVDSDGTGTMKLAASDIRYDDNSLQNVSKESATVTFTSASPTVVTETGHNRTNGEIVQFTNSGGALPTGITAATDYIVTASTTNTYQLLKLMVAVNTSSTGTGTQTVHAAGLQLSGDGYYSSVPVRAISHGVFNESTAGTWASNSTENSLMPQAITYAEQILPGSGWAANSGGAVTGLSGGNVRFTKIGRQVTATIENLAFTSGTNTAGIYWYYGIPPIFRPSSGLTNGLSYVYDAPLDANKAATGTATVTMVIVDSAYGFLIRQFLATTGAGLNFKNTTAYNYDCTMSWTTSQ